MLGWFSKSSSVKSKAESSIYSWVHKEVVECSTGIRNEFLGNSVVEAASIPKSFTALLGFFCDVHETYIFFNKRDVIITSLLLLKFIHVIANFFILSDTLLFLYLYLLTYSP